MPVTHCIGFKNIYSYAIKKDHYGLFIIFNRPCTFLRLITISVILVVNSNQATLRHTEVAAYRCFLPNLTGFPGFRCARPGFHCHLQRADPTGKKPLKGIKPCFSGLQVQGTATSPPSTAKLLTLYNLRLNKAGEKLPIAS